MDDEIVLGSSLSKEILEKYPKAIIQDRIGKIHEILVQDIGSSIKPGHTNSLANKIGRYCNIPWGGYIYLSGRVNHDPKAFLSSLLLLVSVTAKDFRKFYEQLQNILLHFCQRTTYIRALAEVGLDIRYRRLLKIIFKLSGCPLYHRPLCWDGHDRNYILM